MKLQELQANWDCLAQIDPFWAILFDPTKRNENWKEGDFFKTGDEEIERLLAHLETLNISFNRNTALDFGCGAGRLTQGLCRHFQQVLGVDISLTMIKLANKFNRYGDNCIYQVNCSSNLDCFDNNYFDFIYTILVLQHMRPEYSSNYIKEFMRVLAPGGALIFQIPSELAPIPNTKVLPDSAFKARILFEEPFIAAIAGYQVTISVRIINISDHTWPAGDAHQIGLGNHWLNRNGKLIVQDDGRASLPKRLGPTEEVELPITVTAPTVPGNYFLELDLLQERVAWFKDKGSNTIRIRFKVKPHRTKVQPDTTVIKPKIEMYGIPKEQVIELIKSRGGKILGIVEDDSAGREWQSFRYYVTK